MDENVKQLLKEKDKRIYELEKSINEIGSDLAENFYQTIELLTSIISFTERGYDGSHARFVSDKSEAMAKLMGLRRNTQYEIKLAGLFHAIGKISFKDSNLFKYPHEMTKQEYNQFVLYPKISVEILKNHRGFIKILDIVYQHNEKLDGSGFPKGLKGDEIHPGARIIAVVDAYHNLVFKKVREHSNKNVTYTNTHALLEASKDRHKSACKFLESKRKIWFEPNLVDAFIVMMELERTDLSDKQIVRVPVNKVEIGMIFAQDYHSSFGLLIASKGEKVSESMIKPLVSFAENNEIPHKILMLA